MKALVFHGPGDVRHESVPDPELAAPGDAIVEVACAGICGSDLHPYEGREQLDPGTVMGHELAGTVVAAGHEVRAFAPGDEVLSPFSTSCGACFACRRGLTSRCERGQLLGWIEGGRGLHGAQSAYVRVPLAATTLLPRPPELPVEVALLAGDVLATGFFGVASAGAGPGDDVAVVGCGAVGLSAVIAAIDRGCHPVFAIDAVAERLALAARLGAVPLALGLPDLAAALRDRLEGRGTGVVVEAVGSPQAMRLAVDLARPGATIVAVGVHTESSFAFSPREAYERNLTYRAGRCPARACLADVLPLAERRQGDLAAILSDRLPLASGPSAYARFAARSAGCIKVVLAP